MAYTKETFKAAFNRGAEIRVGVVKAQDIATKTAEAAWKLYENTRTATLGSATLGSATLGFQVFGRWKYNENQHGGQPGIEWYGTEFPKLKKKRFGGLWSRDETTEEWEGRIRNAGHLDRLQKKDKKGKVEKDLEGNVKLKSPMEFNFGTVSNTKGSHGSLLQMGDNWNLNVNDAWVTGGVHSHQDFYLAFKLSYDNIFDDTYKHNLSITGRELLGLLLAGYELQTHKNPKTGEVLGQVMVCRNPVHADRLTLEDYAIFAQVFEGPMDDNKMDVIAPMKNNLPADLLSKYNESVAKANNMRKNFVMQARAAKVNLS